MVAYALYKQIQLSNIWLGRVMLEKKGHISRTCELKMPGIQK